MPAAEITTVGPTVAAPTPTNKPHTPASVASAAGTTASPVSALSTVGTGTPTSSASKKSKAHTFGVLKTGTLQKMNPNKSFDKPKERFVVLTSVAIHWYVDVRRRELRKGGGEMIQRKEGRWEVLNCITKLG